MNRLSYGDQIELSRFFNIVHVRNYGGAFSLLSNYQYAKVIFILFPLLIIAALFYILLYSKLDILKTVSLVCVLSGAMGNLYDRVFYGFVVDFLDAHFMDYHWPAFNVADIVITFGICLWILLDVFAHRKKGLLKRV